MGEEAVVLPCWGVQQFDAPWRLERCFFFVFFFLQHPAEKFIQCLGVRQLRARVVYPQAARFPGQSSAACGLACSSLQTCPEFLTLRAPPVSTFFLPNLWFETN